MNKKTQCCVAVFLLFWGTYTFARTPSVFNERPRERQRLVNELRERSSKERAEAKAWAKARGMPMRVDDGRQLRELVAVRNGKPLYIKTLNSNAAISTAANLVRNTAPYNLNGAGLNVGVWDGGSVLSTHQEFGSRVSVKDGAPSHYHATHVGGTIGASGVQPGAKGMAPSTTIFSYKWDYDLSEMAAVAASAPGQSAKVYLSNHSYGFGVGWEWNGSSWDFLGHEEFGQYNSESRSTDEVVFNAQYYLPFWSAGNDRSDTGNGSPPGDGSYKGGYDNIAHNAISKNVMTVGAVNDAVSGGNRSPENGTYTTFTSWGPADDGRIKPDIVANGYRLDSADNDSNSDYAIRSGTSMSSPNACGSAALLVEYYKERFSGGAMRASTLKGLIIHTATDRGRPGPDYQYGWGLMDTKAAADLLNDYAGGSLMRLTEDSLSSASNPSDTFSVAAVGNEPLRVTICWTDPPGEAQGGDDVTTPALVNDLDLRITGPGGTYYPYVLDVANPSHTATTGENNVDNVEQVYIETPTPGQYSIVVDYDGSLSGGEQEYSLLMSGISGDSDGDEMPDYWEYEFFSSTTGAMATADLDGDGLDNLSEFIAGTEPDNDGSVFEVTDVEKASANGSPVVINWSTVPGRLYSVSHTPNLRHIGFTNFLDAIDLPYMQNSYTDTVNNAEDSVFYRVDVRLDD